MALASKLDNMDNYVYAIIGDGEAQEGQIYEAAYVCGKQKAEQPHSLLDNNKMQIDGMTEEINDIEPFDKKGKLLNSLRKE